MLEHVEDMVVRHVVEPVCEQRILDGRVECLSGCETFLEVFACGSHPPRHFNKCDDLAFEACVAQEAVHGFDEDVDAFVAELVSAAGADDEGVVAEGLSEHTVGDAEDFFPHLAAFACECRSLRHEIVLEAVGQHDVAGLAEEFETLACGDVGDGGEGVGMDGALLLYGVF